MSEPKEIFVRLDQCMGCHSCEMACAVEHSASKSLYAALSESPTPKSRLYVEWVVPDHSVPILCRHCEDAPCMHACIAGAISRTGDGVVATDTDRCIGCWTCVMVCPYGVIGRHLQEQKAYRCDRCPDRETPACVNACPTRALVYQSASRYSGQVRKHASRELLSGERD
ncbi:MAG: 4Fe-4S dicluster domain-containing protein [Desulfobacteraceae bacterium]|jgi:carbon-monoxide dehydrogenase iron sulfur subunit